MLNDLTNAQIENLIDEWIHNSRNREIAKGKLIDGITFERLSEIYELSVTQTKNIVQKVKEILLIHLPQE